MRVYQPIILHFLDENFITEKRFSDNFWGQLLPFFCFHSYNATEVNYNLCCLCTSLVRRRTTFGSPGKDF